jgi:hypothetical protein
MTLVAGRKRVPKPAIGKTAVLIGLMILMINLAFGWLSAHYFSSNVNMLMVYVVLIKFARKKL